MSSRRRAKDRRKLERAFADYLARGEEATEAVAIITKAVARIGDRRAWAARPGRLS